jgi:hypothetical protein
MQKHKKEVKLSNDNEENNEQIASLENERDAIRRQKIRDKYEGMSLADLKKQKKKYKRISKSKTGRQRGVEEMDKKRAEQEALIKEQGYEAHKRGKDETDEQYAKEEDWRKSEFYNKKNGGGWLHQDNYDMQKKLAKGDEHKRKRAGKFTGYIDKIIAYKQSKKDLKTQFAKDYGEETDTNKRRDLVENYKKKDLDLDINHLKEREANLRDKAESSKGAKAELLTKKADELHKKRKGLEVNKDKIVKEEEERKKKEDKDGKEVASYEANIKTSENMVAQNKILSKNQKILIENGTTLNDMLKLLRISNPSKNTDTDTSGGGSGLNVEAIA